MVLDATIDGLCFLTPFIGTCRRQFRGLRFIFFDHVLLRLQGCVDGIGAEIQIERMIFIRIDELLTLGREPVTVEVSPAPQAHLAEFRIL